MRPELRFSPIDFASWPRRETFTYFSKMAPTGYSLTVELDATKLYNAVKAAGCRFFPAYLWLVTKDLQRQPEFCLAERDGVLGWFNCLTPLYAAFHEDDKTFSLLWTAYDDEFPAFHAAYLEDKARHGGRHGILGKAGEVPPPNAYTVSCVPWVSFRHFAVHSYGKQPYFLPSVEAGRLRQEGEKRILPLSMTVHHAAADGWQVQTFLTALQRDMDNFRSFL